MKSPKAITFDLDGTLMHSGDWKTSIAFVFQFVRLYRSRLGYRGALQLLRAINRTLKAGLNSKETNENRVLKVMQEELGFKNIDEARADTVATLQKLFVKIKWYFKPKKQMRSLLLSIPSNIRKALVTNPAWSRPVVLVRMGFGNVDPENFEFITTAENHCTLKPDPIYYREVLERLGLEANDVLHVGNELINDGSARLVGIQVFLVDNNKKTLEVTAPDGTFLAPLYTGSERHLKEFLRKIEVTQ
jgi:FMN phosphatase YigB (HAD superfamily)